MSRIVSTKIVTFCDEIDTFRVIIKLTKESCLSDINNGGIYENNR